MIKERIALLRAWMKERNLDAFIIPSADPHMGEYIAPLWKSREWISGFTGSAGTVVVTADKGGLWTDSRYFIQAERQLQGSGLDLYRSFQHETMVEIPAWLMQEMPRRARIGIDGQIFTKAEADCMAELFAKKELELVPSSDPMADLWADRPSLPMSRAEIYDAKYTGQTASERLALLRAELQKLGADSLFITPLEEIAWLLNIRGLDVDYNPVLISYLLVEPDGATLFVHPDKCPESVAKYLKEQGVRIADYGAAFQQLSELKGRRILLPAKKTSIAAFAAVDADANEILTEASPLSWMKAVRTQTEIDGLRNCMVRDGVAMVKFQKWLVEAVQRGERVTEMSLDRKLCAFRAEQDLFRGESFATIAGYAANAASPHYCASPETDTELQPRGYLLLDSGGQYLDGTTDITRTIVLGPLTEDEKIDYTCVLRGNIDLSMVKFPKGTCGTQLDAFARAPMWERGMQYLHGTGHGVGQYLNVHEATDLYQFRMDSMPHPLMLNSNITNEPALYKAGSHGCRTENMLLVCKDQTTEFGDFYRFETLTLCPIDTEAIIRSMMTEREINWLNDYHERVYQKLSPYLNEEEKEWLRDRCQPI